MPANQLVVSRHLQYIAIAVGLVLLVLFTRQISGAIPAFFMAALLAYVLNPLIRRLEEARVPRTVVALGVFAALRGMARPAYRNKKTAAGSCGRDVRAIGAAFRPGLV